MTERKSESGATVLVIQPWPAVDLSLSVERVIWEKFLVEKFRQKSAAIRGTYHVNPLTFTAWTARQRPPLTPYCPPCRLWPPQEAVCATRICTCNSARTISICEKLWKVCRTMKNFVRNRFPAKERSTQVYVYLFASNLPGTLNGQGSISAAPLTLTLTELAGVSKDLKGFAALLGGRAQGIEKIEKLASSGTDFEKLLITFTSSKGIITVTDARCTSPELELSGKGTINLPGETLDLAGTLRVAGVASLPVSMKGPFTKPAYRLDMGRALKKIDLSLQPGGKLEREISRGLEKLFK